MARRESVPRVIAPNAWERSVAFPATGVRKGRSGPVGWAWAGVATASAQIEAAAIAAARLVIPVFVPALGRLTVSVRSRLPAASPHAPG